MDVSERVDSLEQQLSRLATWTQQGDSKTSVVLTAGIAMLGFLVALAPDWGDWRPIDVVVVCASGVPLLVSLAATLLATYPRITLSEQSIIYFERVAAMPLTNYSQTLSSATLEEYCEALAHECHRNSQIVSAKFAWVRAATIVLYVGVAPWAIAVFVLYRN